MKILLINVVYGTGSTGTICTNLSSYFLSQNHVVYYAYGRGAKNKEKNVFKFGLEFESKFWHMISKLTGNMYGGMFLSTHRLKRYIKKINPDVVNIHCINGFCLNVYSIIKFLKKKSINTCITHHAEFLYTGTCGFSIECNAFKTQCLKCPLKYKNVNKNFKKMQIAFEKTNFKHIAVSPWVEKRIRESTILKDKNVRTILNPTVTNEVTKNPFSNTNSNILFVASNFKTIEKGAIQIFKIASMLKNYKFYVVGSSDYQDLENIKFLGCISNKELANYFYNADCSITLSKRESFGMVVSESLSYGTPIVGFKNGGSESIAISEYSSFVSQGDYDAFCQSVKHFIDNKISKQKIINESAQRYSLTVIGNLYIKCYEE